jgi:hypothetical protein
MQFHDQHVTRVGHIPRQAQLLTTGSFIWQNTTGRDLWLQQLSYGADGAITVQVKVNGDIWTSTQQSTGSGLAENPSPLSLNQGDSYSFEAHNENQEIYIPPDATIEIDYLSGSGNLNIAFILAYGDG